MVSSKLQFKQFSAHVKVDGKALECYSIWVDKKAKHVSCWIASEAGKAFSVIFEKEETKRACATYLSVDGTEVDVPDDIFLREEDQSEWDFMKTSKGKGRSFKFSPLNVIEGEVTKGSPSEKSETPTTSRSCSRCHQCPSRHHWHRLP
ncbi:hypothetical protein M413DRAFT_440642 [Hebeloma cylindrosporum]|uniref:Uncharacterized protein n=1 Tax=Hebeloma cylindrosporum TaxID=76867 RepID=A0A0C3CED8_HEBCY|nr:hypothetical protein M413DRAFT_440642 [Hebeloma cylindrosporum h7]